MIDDAGAFCFFKEGKIMEEKSSEIKKEFLAGSLGASVYQISEEEAEFIEQACYV